MEEQKRLEKELLKKKIIDLKRIAAGMDPPVKPKFNWTRKMYAKALLDAGYKSKVPGAQQIKDKKVTASRPGQQQPLNPEFEKTITEPETEPKKKAGGVREGAGRPKGMTDEKAKVRNLPQVPSHSIKHGAVSLFLFWSKKAAIKDLALTDEEAELWSLPATQLQENYYPGLIPEILSIWIEFIYATIRIMEVRFDLINKVRKQRREQREQTESGTGNVKLSGWNGEVKHYKYNDGHGLLKPIHAIPAGEQFLFTEDLEKVTCPTCVKIIDKARS